MESYLLLVDALEAPTTDLASELRRGGSVVRIARHMHSAADLLSRAPPALIVIRAEDVTLRQKLEDDHRQPRLILNQRRVGYRLQGPLLVTKEKIW